MSISYKDPMKTLLCFIPIQGFHLCFVWNLEIAGIRIQIILKVLLELTKDLY